MAKTEFTAAALGRAWESATADIQRQIVRLIEGAAVTLRSRLQRDYPEGPTGNLRSRISISQPRSFTSTGTGVNIPTKVVRASSPHVHIYQSGTRARYDATRANAYRGISPPHGKILERDAAEVRGVMLAMAEQIVNRRREVI
jgi:hypothetical protein